ncbi:hypothetical protein Saa2_06511 [Streptomyces acidiscabies]|nr:hypothetical protein Saa2_06511 [Streptomyces acidiscabies]
MSLYQEVQHFYAHQMRCLDSGDAAGWARGRSAGW